MTHLQREVELMHNKNSGGLSRGRYVGYPFMGIDDIPADWTKPYGQYGTARA
jgi:hypothetical protein